MITDTLYGPVTSGIFTWSLRNSSEIEISNGNSGYDSGVKKWIGSKTFTSGLTPGNYTVLYSITTDRGRRGSAVANLTVPGIKATVSGVIRNVLDRTPIEGVTVCLYDAYAIWQIALQLFGGTIPSPEELSIHLSPIRQATTGPDGQYEWNDIPLGNAYIVYASKTGYLEKYTDPFPLQAANTTVVKNLSLPDSTNTLAGLISEVEYINGISEDLLNYNAKLAGEMTEQWYEDDLYSYNNNWFSIVGGLIGSAGVGLHNIAQEGYVTVSQETMKEIAKHVLLELAKGGLPPVAFNKFRAWLQNNTFPEDELAYRASVAHTPYLEQLIQNTQDFESKAPTHSLADGFSIKDAEELSKQIIEQTEQVIKGKNVYVASPDYSKGVYGFTFSDMVDGYMKLSQQNEQLQLAQNILSIFQIVGGILSVVGDGVAPIAATATQVAGFVKSLTATANVVTKVQMGSQFAIGICGTYPSDNKQAVNVLEDYVNLIYSESASPFYLHMGNNFSASTDINLNLWIPNTIYILGLLPGFDVAVGNATVNITDNSNVTSGGEKISVRCVGYSVWSPTTIGGLLGFSEESLLVSSEVRGPTTIDRGGCVQYTIPYRGYSRNFVSMFKPHYLQVDTYIGPWRVDSDYAAYYVIAPLEIFRPITLRFDRPQLTSDTSEVLSCAVNADGGIRLAEIKAAQAGSQKLIEATLSATDPSVSVQFVADANLYAIDLRVFAPQESTISVMITDSNRSRLGYSPNDGITYNELLGSVTNMAQRPISVRLLEPPEGEIYTVEIALLSPGSRDIPVALFYEPVQHFGATMIAFPSSVILDGHGGTTQNVVLRLAEGFGQQALTKVNARLGPITKWGANKTLPIVSNSSQSIGDIPAGEQCYISWDVNYPVTAKYGKYVGIVTIDSNETADLNVPVVALIRCTTETVGSYEGPDPNIATVQKSIVLDPNGRGLTWVHIPREYRVLHATMGVVGASANLENPTIDIGADGSPEWIFSGKFNMGVLVNNVERAFNDYLSSRQSDPNGVKVPILVTGSPNEKILLNGIQLFLDRIPGDFDFDYDADLLDLATFCSHWLDIDCNDPHWCDKTDLDHSTKVDFADFSTFAQYWEKIVIGDLDIDRDADFGDYAFFAQRWRDENCSQNEWCDGADLDKSGKVDILDLAVFAEHWLEGTGH
jgi:hypothetical protein